MYCSTGKVHVRIAATNICFVDVPPDNLEAKVPLLLEPKVLVQLNFHLAFDEDMLYQKYDGLTLSLMEKLEHKNIV